MLFHVTISHTPAECPGRRPAQPPELVAPSDTREALAKELGVTLHFVLWGAACMLWAQPEHLAFAVLEAEDVESASLYIQQVVPSGWTCSVLPVWNLPAQLRLVRQVHLAPPMQFGQALRSASSPAEAVKSESSPVSLAGDPGAAEAHSSAPGAAPVAPAAVSQPSPSRPPADATTNPRPTLPPAPGTITRVLTELEAGSAEPLAAAEEARPEASGLATSRPPDEATRILSQPAEAGPPVASAWLVATAGPARGKTFVVTHAGAVIGRLPDSPVSIADDRLSREHARVDFRGGDYWLVDLGSTNGTALNGVLVTEPRPLASGDTIELGSSILVVTIQANTPV